MPYYCYKKDSIDTLTETYSDDVKVAIFLTYKMRELRKKKPQMCECGKKHLDCMLRGDMRKHRINYFNRLKDQCSAIKQIPMSQVRRDYGIHHKPVLIRAYCRWVICEKKSCAHRKRGHKCKHQTKLEAA